MLTRDEAFAPLNVTSATPQTPDDEWHPVLPVPDGAYKVIRISSIAFAQGDTPSPTPTSGSIMMPKAGFSDVLSAMTGQRTVGQPISR